jgi:hypothetical protein
MLTNYAHFPPSPKPVPHVYGPAAEMNLHRSLGVSQLLHQRADYRPAANAEPHVKGDQAHENYNAAQGQIVNTLFHQYGRLPQSARAEPKVKYDGVTNYNNARGEMMRKTLANCPLSHRRRERLQASTVWP